MSGAGIEEAGAPATSGRAAATIEGRVGGSAVDADPAPHDAVHATLSRQLRAAYGPGLGATLWRTAALLPVSGVAFVLFVAFIGYVVLG